MRFKGKDIFIDRETAIKAVIEVCENICDGTTTCAKDEIIKALEEITPLAFICDRKKCENCSFPTCEHVFDIKHAKNFRRLALGVYVERKEQNK